MREHRPWCPNFGKLAKVHKLYHAFEPDSVRCVHCRRILKWNRIAGLPVHKMTPGAKRGDDA